jgi:RNA polymerase sigma-70 factor (ECF subfamily)
MFIHSAIKLNGLYLLHKHFSMTDEQMISGIKQKQTAAQHYLYQKYSAKLLGVCYRYAKNKMDAEDMLQEGLIKVYQEIHQFRGDGSLEGWIRRIVVNTCINILKKSKKFSDSVDITQAYELHTPAHWIPSFIQAKQIVECIRLLPIGYRTVLNLYAIEGYSHREIGALLEIEESTSRSQYSRAKQMLENMLIRMDILPAKKQTTIKLTKK